MVGRERIQEAVLKALKGVRGADADIVAVDSEVRLARFSNSEIHQNSVLSNTDLTVRVAVGQKVGVVRTNHIEDLPDAIRRANDVALLLPDSRTYAGMPGPSSYQAVDSYRKSTSQFTARDIANAAGVAITRADKAGVSASGTVSIEEAGTLVANTNGVLA